MACPKRLIRVPKPHSCPFRESKGFCTRLPISYWNVELLRQKLGAKVTESDMSVVESKTDNRSAYFGQSQPYCRPHVDREGL
jgi:hypothetical protein